MMRLRAGSLSPYISRMLSKRSKPNAASFNVMSLRVENQFLVFSRVSPVNLGMALPMPPTTEFILSPPIRNNRSPGVASTLVDRSMASETNLVPTSSAFCLKPKNSAIDCMMRLNRLWLLGALISLSSAWNSGLAISSEANSCIFCAP